MIYQPNQKCGPYLDPKSNTEKIYYETIINKNTDWKFNNIKKILIVCMYVCMYLFIYCLFTDTPLAYGSSQAKGPIGAVAAGLHHNHSNAGSKPCQWPTLQLTVTLDP